MCASLDTKTDRTYFVHICSHRLCPYHLRLEKEEIEIDTEDKAARERVCLALLIDIEARQCMFEVVSVSSKTSSSKCMTT
jgi:hypothetical protein